jgi:hypothetical protein
MRFSRLLVSVGVIQTRPLNGRRHGAEPTPAATPGRLEHLQVQTRFLRLYQPAVVGDRIDGWHVCWIGGWDKGKVLFVVMVERVVRGGASAALEHRRAGESD